MNKTILVTGSSRGIGKAIALYLARQGFDLVIHCRSQRLLAEQVVAEIEHVGQTARILQFDIADRAQSAAQINQDIETHGAYYGVVCNDVL
jgi:3-oxoacyl-[acyl-carrier protein] reductase